MIKEKKNTNVEKNGLFEFAFGALQRSGKSMQHASGEYEYTE